MKQRVVVTNRGEKPMSLVLEPWACEYLLAPEDRCDLIFSGEVGDLEVRQETDRLVIYGYGALEIQARGSA